jgi:nicotinamidase-related amidase
MPHPTRLDSATSAVLVVDVQEKLMVKIAGADAIVRNIAFLLDAAPLLGVEVIATEQYPKGLGPTVAALAKRLQDRPEKLTFSCCGAPEVSYRLRRHGRTQVVLVGIEAHVCVLNTALDLLADGYAVYVAVDAVGSRFAIDRDTALRRIEQAGVIPITVEAAVFEWMVAASHPKFKQVSALVRERTETPPTV